MLVDDFDFQLPANLIAERPVSPRDAARLLLWPNDGAERHVRDLPGLLKAGDLLVFNDTKVIPARLYGRREREPLVQAEVLLLKPLGARRWSAMAKPARRLKLADRLLFGDGIAAEVSAKSEGVDGLELTFECGDAELLAALEKIGAMPLPPYIVAQRPADARDRQDYQTVYAAREGAIAAPTAGLHFTPELLQALEAHGIQRASVTLHVGAGTFLPVKAEKVAEHRMHAEWGEVSQATAEAITAAKARGGRVVAVGTTSLRLLETAARATGQVQPWSGDTDIFITPGFRFQAVDALMTNFHLPRSTLVMLVAAFIGWPEQRALYAQAIASGYRFYSYGDSSLLFRAPQ